MSKTVRNVIIAGVIVVAVPALIFHGQHSRDRSALAAYKAELRAKGEKLTPEELGYPRPPESSQSLDKLRAGLSHIGSLKYHPGSLELMRFVGAGRVQIGWATAQPPFNAAWSNRTNSPSWGEFCAELDSIGGPLAEIRAATQNPPRYFFNDPTNFPNRPKGPFVELRNAAHWLMGDAAAALHEGQLDRAHADLHALTQLAQFYREDLTLVSQMIRAAIAGIGLATTWEALQAPGWSEENLAAMERDWETVDLADLFEKGMIGERAFGGAVIAHLRAISPKQRMNFLNPAGNRVARRTVEDYFEQFVAMPLWVANSEIDELFYLQWSQSNLDAFRQLRSGAPWPVVSQLLYTNIHGMEGAFTNPLTRHRYFVSGFLMPNIIRVANACIQNETQRRLTITAIALERQRLRNGKFPTDLKALVPQFLSAVPMDLMGGKPLRYRLNANGDFTLYSVGENGRDDGGDPNPSSATDQFGLGGGKDAVWPTAAK